MLARNLHRLHIAHNPDPLNSPEKPQKSVRTKPYTPDEVLLSIRVGLPMRSYSLVTRSLLRACVIVANVFGRVALSVTWSPVNRGFCRVWFCRLVQTKARGPQTCQHRYSLKRATCSSFRGLGFAPLCDGDLVCCHTIAERVCSNPKSL